jgi:hypothetical protein
MGIFTATTKADRLADPRHSRIADAGVADSVVIRFVGDSRCPGDRSAAGLHGIRDGCKTVGTAYVGSNPTPAIISANAR